MLLFFCGASIYFLEESASRAQNRTARRRLLGEAQATDRGIDDYLADHQ